MIRLTLFAALLLALANARAGLSVSLGNVAATGWHADDVVLQLASGQADGFRLAGRLGKLASPLGEWSGVTFRCEVLTHDQDGYHCPDLTLTADDLQGRQQLTGELHYRDAAQWSLTLNGFAMAGGRWQLVAATTTGPDSGWKATLKATGVRLAQAFKQFPQPALPVWGWQGRTDLQLDLSGKDGTPAKARLGVKLRDSGWASPDGLQAAEKLSATLTVDAHRRGVAWSGKLQTHWHGGQIYADPVFVDFSRHSLTLTSSWRWNGPRSTLALSGLDLEFGKLLAVAGSLDVPTQSPAGFAGNLVVRAADLARVYPVLLQPFGYGGALGRLQMAGNLSAQLGLQDGLPVTVDASLAGVHLDDERGRFGISGLSADLHWAASGPAADSHLDWQSGHLYHVNFGQSSAAFNLHDKAVTLRRPLVLPVLNGRLRIPSLVATDIGGRSPSWRTSLQAESLSLPLLTQALGWPALSGELSVQIPDVHYADETLALDGEVVAQVFDGTVRVSGLKLRDPLSPAPVLLADARLERLNLERITQVFDFGRITGRLVGRVSGLELVGWQPVAFDAVLETPSDDDMPHRISQRAVENLTALGNNGAAALSGTFLRVFESFRYDRLLLRVNLRGQRALLDGIPNPDGGYYLVKGAGLPRIDVIGRNRDVAWRDLVERLRRISLKGAQVR